MFFLKLFLDVAVALAITFCLGAVGMLWPPAVKGVGLGGVARIWFIIFGTIAALGAIVGFYTLYLLAVL